MGVESRSRMELAELATAQYGVVSSADLRRLGYGRRSIQRAAGSGQLHRVHRGVYALGHRHLTGHGRCLAAVLACGQDAVLTHSSAAWLWGLLRTCPVEAEVTVPARGRSRVGISLHHAPALALEDRTRHEGIPVSSPARTLLDLATVLSRPRLERCVERAEELKLFDLRAVDSVLGRTRGHHGVGRLRRAVGAYREPAFTRSGLERRFLALVRRSDLPLPQANVYIHGFELDMYWPDLLFAVELDSFATHGSSAAFERDRLRQEELKLAGIEMVRVTDRRLATDPTGTVERLSVLLKRRRAELARRRNHNQD